MRFVGGLIRCARWVILAVLCAASSARAQSRPEHDDSATPTLPRTERAQTGRSLARRPDERRPENQYSTTLFGRPLTIGGEYEILHQNRQNFDLDRTVAANRGRLDQELKLELFHRTTKDVSVFLQVLGLSEIDTHRSAGNRTSEYSAERGQMWVYINRPFDK